MPCRRLLYAGVLLTGVVIVASGLAIWKPVQLQELAALFGGYEGARLVHFFAMAAIVLFLVRPCRHGTARAQEPARHDPRPLKEEPMRRSRQRAPGVDAGLLVKDAAKLLPDPSRRLFLRNTASLGALALLTGCDIVDGPSAEKALRVVSQFNDWVQARLFNPNRLARDLSRERHHAPVSVQRLLPRGGRARRRRGPLQADRRRPGREQAAVDAGAALRVAAGDADHAAHLRRGLERDRQMDRRAA